MIDPPSGWKYGFPKPMPKNIGDRIAWLKLVGYPESMVLSYGDHFYCRYWQQELEEEVVQEMVGHTYKKEDYE